jgi:hypothetical protein
MVAFRERIPTGGALAVWQPPRAAGGPGFRDTLKGLMPDLPAGTGMWLAGVPVAMEAVNQLNLDPWQPRR